MDIFEAIPLFQGLGIDRKRQLAPHLRLAAFKRGDRIMEKGSPRKDLGFLLEGRLSMVEFTPGGREIALGFIQPGEHFGELALIDGQPRSASIIGNEPGRLALLPEAQARELLYHEPIVARRVMERLAAALRSANAQRVILAQPQARARVYTLILHTLRRQDGQWWIERLPSRIQIAMLANTTRETATRAISHLLASGILSKQGDKLIVTDIHALEREALGEPQPAGPSVAPQQHITDEPPKT